MGKLAQAAGAWGQRHPDPGDFDKALTRRRGEIQPEAPDRVLVNSVNRIALRDKNRRFEVIDALGDAPDIHCIPVGNRAILRAYWKGYNEYRSKGQFQAVAQAVGVFRPPAPRRSS